ncbi:MAG: 2,3-diphosphoglycerate-dependent phosphoglycerate mutase [Chloroflexi bacterium]|nr:2,3-diphosphoglycerate-dependent phosphoglycerate mutase [Chloroflexota bacterium]MYD16876.1 2,3-diphosphoglycerate-dependent phosphoglycerate mutase [Chloroflexota bacterium]MYJ01724.1 2,3-diphosphoglycerate-dependent phosphoglycerate mutase [Chloroflexota bacterium]
MSDGANDANDANLVLVRHGQSQWNLENRFTGWIDVDLTTQGVAEAHTAGRQIREAGIEFNAAWTSVLQRAIHTLWIILDEIEAPWLPVEREWRLNERHYGALQGLNKAETAAEHGEDQVLIWRRSYDIPPPPLDRDHPDHPRFDRRYRHAPQRALPAAESLKLTLERVLPWWESNAAPALRDGQRLLIAAHGNSIRAIVKHLESISDEEIVGLNIPTGMPLAYTLDRDLSVSERGYLAGENAAAEAAAAVAAQGRSAPSATP